MHQKPRIVFGILTIILTLTTTMVFHAKAQDAPAFSSPTDIVDHIMSMVGQGRVDEAVTLMDGLNSHDDLKQDVRGQLIHLRDEQGQYHSYEIAATQKFTANFQRVDIIANYDEQPVLLRISFYRPQGGDGKWTVLYLHVHTNILEVLDILKDAPVDYYAGHTAKR